LSDPIPSADDRRPRWYGRRHGHRLRKGRQDLLTGLLPKVRVVPPPHGGRLDLFGLFAEPVADIWLEVGFGAGEHLAAQARANPNVGMIGCEPFVNGVASLLARIDDENLTNIRIFDDDARLLFDALPDARIGRAFTLFSDPWPKKRHHRRRFITPETLDSLARILGEGAELRFASDHMGYVSWALRHVTGHPYFLWPARGPGDWRWRPDDGFETRYETKARAQGATCVYLSFRRRDRGGACPGARTAVL
jgi:tRNA (guanine-N7-)-methyltransferase